MGERELSQEAMQLLAGARYYVQHKVPAMAAAAFAPRIVVTEPGEVGGVVLTRSSKLLIDPQYLEKLVAENKGKSAAMASMALGGILAISDKRYRMKLKKAAS